MILYEKDGWLNIPEILKLKTPFIFVVGGRGIGKTYGAIKYALEHDEIFMLTRRTQQQADMISMSELSPLKSPCADMGLNYCCHTLVKNCTGIYTVSGELETFVGYVTGLSTISSLRGFDASDVTLWIFDEFIPERHERSIKFEGEAFLNAYETISRNRELQGKQPLKAICLSNSNDVGNPIFNALGLSDIAMKMQKKKQSLYINNERGITIILPQNSPISARKKETALYKASGNGRFADMALTNAFEEETNIGHRNLTEYTPIVACGKLHFYQHKHIPEIYCTYHAQGTCTTYAADSTSVTQFKGSNMWLKAQYIMGQIVFENIEIKRDFEKIFITKS